LVECPAAVRLAMRRRNGFPGTGNVAVSRQAEALNNQLDLLLMA
jgi:hypothetical protein